MADVILDCDTGTDDAVAIMLAGLSGSLRVLGVTTVDGNVPVDVVTENTLRVLQHVGLGDVPVFRGASHPLRREHLPVSGDEGTTSRMHGTYLELAPSRRAAEPVTAVEALVGEARRHRVEGSDLVIVATGPLTNIAACVEDDPEFASGVTRLVVMGGGHAIGNATPSAEFNFWADPEAAKVVVGAGFRDLTLVPLDATHQALLDLDDCRRLAALGTPAGIATAAVVEQRIRAHDAEQPMERPGTAPVHDALCVALLLDPEAVRVESFFVDVETRGELTLGRSVIDVQRRSGRTPNARVAVSASAARLVDLLAAVFAAER